MKKLIIAAAIVCVAVASQASQFKWSASGVKDITGENNYSGMATLYIYAADAGIDTAWEIDSKSMSNGAIAMATVSDASIVGGTKYTAYYTMTDTDGNVFTSGTKTFVAPSNTATPIQAFAAAGSWTPVPEPTSGLLLLLGVAGLSLRRRRA